MERRLIKQGRNALTVTLPFKWIQEKGLSSGDVVDLLPHNEGVLVQVGKQAKKKEITIDVRKIPNNLCYHLVIGKYIQGYDSITVLHDSQPIVEEIVRALLGMILAEYTQKRAVYKSMIAIPDENFHTVMRRASHILVEQAHRVVEVSSGSATFNDVKMQERLLDRHILYALRYLNKYEAQVHAYRNFLLCSVFEEVGDLLSILAHHTPKNTAQSIAHLIETYMKLLYEKKVKELHAFLNKHKKGIAHKTYVDGLYHALIEALANFLGYVVES